MVKETERKRGWLKELIIQVLVTLPTEHPVAALLGLVIGLILILLELF